jgi:hypothetical protein
LAGLRLWLSPCSQADATHAFADDTGTQVTRHQVRRNYDATLRRDISAAAFALIQAADARRTIGELLRTHGDGQPGLFDEILALWDERWVMVRP